MRSWAELNERCRQYMQAIYETDQEQEADERGVRWGRKLRQKCRYFFQKRTHRVRRE
jgi:hypothetical protein